MLSKTILRWHSAELLKHHFLFGAGRAVGIWILAAL